MKAQQRHSPIEVITRVSRAIVELSPSRGVYTTEDRTSYPKVYIEIARASKLPIAHLEGDCHLIILV